MEVRPAKTQSSQIAGRKLWSFATHWLHIEDWSDWEDADQLCCNSSIVVRLPSLLSVFLLWCCPCGNLLPWLPTLCSVFFLTVLFQCLKLRQKKRARFGANKTDLNPLHSPPLHHLPPHSPVIILLTFPRRFLWCTPLLYCKTGFTEVYGFFLNIRIFYLKIFILWW